MRSSLFFALVLLASGACSSNADLGRNVLPPPGSVSGSHIPPGAFDNPDGDLPAVGRSTFDFLVRENANTVPFPFEQMLKIIQTGPSGIKTTAGLAATLIPYGRSAMRGVTDVKSPYVVIAGRADSEGTFGELSMERNVLIAYAERAETLEVISYNADAGRFEFQKVLDYASGKTPRVVYAERAFCTACHQDGLPLMPIERTHQATVPARDTYEQELDTFHDQEFHGLTAYNAKSTDSLETPIASAAQDTIPLQMVWQKGCGPKSEAGDRCRRALMKIFLTTAASSTGPSAEFLAAADAVWPAGGLPLRQWRLSGQPETPSMLPMITAMTPVPSGLRPENEARLRELSKVSPLSIAQDPLTPRETSVTWRPADPGTIYALVTAFGRLIPEALELRSLVGSDGLSLDAALQSPGGARIFEVPGLSRTRVVNGLRAAYGKPTAPLHCCEDTEGTLPAVLEGQ